MGQEPLAQVEPDALDGVELGCIGWQGHQGDVAGHLQVARAVPSRLIQHEHSVSVWCEGRSETDGELPAPRADPGGRPFLRFCQLPRQTGRRTPLEAVILTCRKNGEHGRRMTEMKHATAVGGNMLVVADVRAEVVAEFVVAATEALG